MSTSAKDIHVTDIALSGTGASVPVYLIRPKGEFYALWNGRHIGGVSMAEISERVKTVTSGDVRVSWRQALRITAAMSEVKYDDDDQGARIGVAACYIARRYDGKFVTAKWSKSPPNADLGLARDVSVLYFDHGMAPPADEQFPLRLNDRTWFIAYDAKLAAELTRIVTTHKQTTQLVVARLHKAIGLDR